MRTYAWVAVALVCCASAVAMAGETMSVQGLLRSSDGVPLASGTYSMRFGLYDGASTGTQRWQETHDGANKATVTGGLYAAELGGITPFAAGLFSTYADLWLEVEVDRDDNGTFEEVFAPRVKLTSAPYAHEAKNAAALEGQGASAFAAASHTHDAAAIISGELPDERVSDDLTISSSGSVDGGAIKSGTVAEPRIDAAIARDSELPPRQFDTIVAPTGGDYTTIQAALAASKKTIFVRNGTYVLTSDINITQDGTAIIGESRDGVIIDCNNTAFGIKAIGDAASYYPGLTSIAKGTNIVTGSGTTFIGNVTAGEYISLYGYWYKIQSVDSNTQLTLVEIYRGRTISLGFCNIASMRLDISLENLTVKNHNNVGHAAIEFQWVLNGVIRNCAVNHNVSYGIALKEAYHCKLNKNLVAHNEVAIYLISSAYDSLCENTCVNNESNGIVLQTSGKNGLNDNTCENNGGAGIYLALSSNNSITGCSCDMNGIGISLSSGSGNCLQGNTCYLNDDYGIFLDTSNDNTVSANSCYSNDLDGIRVTSADRNALVGNSSRSNGWNGTGYGINITDAASDNNVAIGNVLFGNDGAGNDAGTGTMKANNYPAF